MTTPPFPALTSRQLADLLGVTDRTLRELAERGIVVRQSYRGPYDVAVSIANYCAHLRGVAAGRGGEERVASLTGERARLAAAQADLAAIKIAKERGELLDAAEVEMEWTSVLRSVRSRLLAIPSRLRSSRSAIVPDEIAALDAEIRAALEELAPDDDIS
jgi:phage terminase Nu1 subunit (DNA packaging protein)